MARAKTTKPKTIAAPQLRYLGPKSRKEVWFEETTILFLIAACIEVIDGGNAKNDTEMVGLLYGKSFNTEPGLPQNRYYVRRGYVIQNAQREEASVSYSSQIRDKMNSFFNYNLRDEPLGSFHLHPNGSSQLSRADKINRFEPGQLKFLIFLKEKQFIKDDVSSGGASVQITSIDDKYYELNVRCKVGLRRENRRRADFFVTFGVRGWYRYDVGSDKRYAPVSIMIV